MSRQSQSFYRQSFIGLIAFVSIWMAGSACTSAVKSAEEVGGAKASSQSESSASAQAALSQAPGQEQGKLAPAGSQDDIRKVSDELTAVVQGISSSNEEPNKIRERFNSLLREYRAKNVKALKDERAEFARVEREEREAFTKNQQTERASFLQSKVKPEERQRFFSDHESKRKDFFTKANDKRKAFEAKLMEKRKAFDEDSRAKSAQFAQSLKEYSTAFHERRKAEALKKKAEAKSVGQPAGGISGQIQDPLYPGANEVVEGGATATSGSTAAGSVSGHVSGAATAGASKKPADPYQEWKAIPKSPAKKLGVPAN